MLWHKMLLLMYIQSKSDTERTAAILDAMAVLRCTAKPKGAKICNDLAHSFMEQVGKKLRGYSECHIVFDTTLKDPQDAKNKGQFSIPYRMQTTQELTN